MNSVVIHAENLGKRYRIGERERYLALRDVIARAASAPLCLFRSRNPSSPHGHPNHIWALKNVSFEVRQGDVVGLIGRNGSGKTTLLKILAQVTKPTEGFAVLRGRVGSLLEVGTGFHPELTGRENIFLGGAILGMTKAEIRRKFDEIVAFAQVEQFIDTSLKHFSSGMQTRLAFSIAAHLEPEIMLVDEVLAVGDTAFQKKCLGKLGDVAKEGRTILFVSHSMASVVALCKTTILLEGGVVKAAGDSATVVRDYLTSPPSATGKVDLRHCENRQGSGEVRFVCAGIYNEGGRPCSVFNNGDNIHFEVVVEAARPSPEMIFSLGIGTILGVPVLNLLSKDDPTWVPVRILRRAKLHCVLKACPLYPGVYVVRLWMSPNHYERTDSVRDVLQFRVEQGPLLARGFEMTWQHGLVHVSSSWRATPLEEGDTTEETNCVKTRAVETTPTT
jgi:lipopolysaccharide transport system ATP-binding protein